MLYSYCIRENKKYLTQEMREKMIKMIKKIDDSKDIQSIKPLYF